MRPVTSEYDKIWKGSSAPARLSVEALEAFQIRTRIIRSPYGGRCSPDLELGLYLSRRLGGEEPRDQWRRTLLLSTPIRQVVLVQIDWRWLPHPVQANGFYACGR